MLQLFNDVCSIGIGCIRLGEGGGRARNRSNPDHSDFSKGKHPSLPLAIADFLLFLIASSLSERRKQRNWETEGGGGIQTEIRQFIGINWAPNGSFR